MKRAVVIAWAGVLSLSLVGAPGVFAQSGKPSSTPMKGSLDSAFDGYAGSVSLIAPMNGAVELLVATHLRAWVGCDAEAYIPTVGGFIYEKLGGATSSEDMRSGLETRYPGNPIVRIVVTRIHSSGENAWEVTYVAEHKDGLAVGRVLHVGVGPRGLRVHRVTRLR